MEIVHDPNSVHPHIVRLNPKSWLDRIFLKYARNLYRSDLYSAGDPLQPDYLYVVSYSAESARDVAAELKRMFWVNEGAIAIVLLLMIAVIIASVAVLLFA